MGNKGFQLLLKFRILEQNISINAVACFIVAYVNFFYKKQLFIYGKSIQRVKKRMRNPQNLNYL